MVVSGSAAMPEPIANKWQGIGSRPMKFQNLPLEIRKKLSLLYFSQHKFEPVLELTQKPLLERYGMTEFGMGLSQPYDESRRISCSVGRPMSSVKARVRTEDGTTGKIEIY